MKTEEIDWSKIDEDDIYDKYDSLDFPMDKAEMLLHLLKFKPTPELDYIELFREIDDELIFQHKVEILEQIVDAYAQHLPKEFINDYEYLIKSLLDYYFFTNNIQGIEKHLGFIKKHPAKGVDLITIPLMWQFTYFGYYTHALELSKAVWEPLLDDEKIWGPAHAPFCTCIYLYELEQAYLNPEVSRDAFYNNINEIFELDETEEGKQTIFYCLQNPFSKTEIDTHIQNKEYQHANLKMNIWFLVYTKQEFDVPFMLSDRWWNLLSATKIFGHDKNDYWYIPYNVLDEHFFKHTDNMMGVNQLEIFGKVHALEYAYHFINRCGLLSGEANELMSENITALKYVYAEYNTADLWRMTFIFNWPQLYAPNPSVEKIYRDTFCKDHSDMIAFENNQQLIFNLMRPELQAQVKEKNHELFDEYSGVDEDAFNENLKLLLDDPDAFEEPQRYSAAETYVKTEPDVGRNDPCPCGSGKKYKKCCLN